MDRQLRDLTRPQRLGDLILDTRYGYGKPSADEVNRQIQNKLERKRAAHNAADRRLTEARRREWANG